MLMMALLPPGGLLGGYAGDPDGVNGSWEEACTCVSTSIRVRVAVAAGEYPRHLPQRLFLACPRPARAARQGGSLPFLAYTTLQSTSSNPIQVYK